MTPAAEFRKATKSFRGNPAFRNVDITFLGGEIQAVLGENGAGKSTLTKVLAGLYPLTEGTLEIDSKPADLASPAEARRRGVAMVFQETNLIPSMTVAQNIFLGNERFFNRLRGINIAAQQHLQRLNFHVDPGVLVSTLGAAKKQMVEIARAVYNKAKIFIFDEPTATLTPEEKQHFFDLLIRLRAEGAAIIFITHALEEALTVADRITVLRDGQLVVTDAATNFTRARIIEAMVGRTLQSDLYSKLGKKRVTRHYGARVLSLDNLNMGRMVRGATLSVFEGQITGLFGLVGAGRSEMMKIVAGILKRDFLHGGGIRHRGEPVRFRVPRQAMKRGIAYVTEDRKADGFFDVMGLAQNVFLGQLATRDNPMSVIRMSDAHKVAAQWVEKMQVKTLNPNGKVVELSGGNQQKVVIAKSLIQNPSLIIFDEPTRGIDVGAIAEIHQLIRDLADKGCAVIVISSYLPEVLNISDRILVARQGRIVEEFTAAEATEESVMYAAVH
jgi:ABC-type sugar transport system ATPase subunit